MKRIEGKVPDEIYEFLEERKDQDGFKISKIRSIIEALKLLMKKDKK